jgi:hypothetical protein
MPDVDREFPHLCQLMGGYFHQDWDLVGPDTESVLEGFASVNTRNEVSLAHSELETLLSRCLDESELAKNLDTLGCYYYPIGDGITYDEWLRQVAAWLSKFLEKQAK